MREDLIEEIWSAIENLRAPITCDASIETKTFGTWSIMGDIELGYPNTGYIERCVRYEEDYFDDPIDELTEEERHELNYRLRE